MKTAQLHIQSLNSIEFLDLSDAVQAEIKKIGFQNGLCLIFTEHTTSALVLNEKCEDLQKDMIHFLKKWVPAGQGYRHDAVAVDGRPNAHSHLLALALPSSVTIPVVEGCLKMGAWQKIFFVELDGPRASRTVTINCLAEASSK